MPLIPTLSSAKRRALVGEFNLPAVPVGVYEVTAAQPGFNSVTQSLVVASDTSPVLHFELAVAGVQQSVTVTTSASESQCR